MADLNINDLTGSDLFDDAESFLDELDDREMAEVEGGATVGTLVIGTIARTVTIQQSATIIQTATIIG